MSSSDNWKRLRLAVEDSPGILPTGWRLEVPQPNESFRWVHDDGRWVSAEIGRDDFVGQIIVKDSTGRVEHVDSYEGALALGQSWRT